MLEEDTDTVTPPPTSEAMAHRAKMVIKQTLHYNISSIHSLTMLKVEKVLVVCQVHFLFTLHFFPSGTLKLDHTAKVCYE